MDEMHLLVLSFYPRCQGVLFGIVPVRHRDFTQISPMGSLSGGDADAFVEWFLACGIEIRSGNSALRLGPDELFEARMRWV